MGTDEAVDPFEPSAASTATTDHAGRAPMPSWADEATVAVPLAELFGDDPAE
jgi:hypothetical protein